MTYGPRVQFGDSEADIARPMYPTNSTAVLIGQSEQWGFPLWLQMEELTVSANNQRNEEPCSRSNNVMCMQQSHNTE